ncbi:MAG: hypothetical protein L6R38_006609 [Xanthoria sp. 2 TBL-2021]|nr:MAG: hypothetical protein L6R38_006609 [Xanthoria sp. 2 TBL-2021]
MSAKLDMALDDVVMTERTARRRGRGGRRAPNAARKATAPVAGVQKNTRPVRGPLKSAVANGLAAGSGESKIIPTDVTEKNVKNLHFVLAVILSISEQSSENSTAKHSALTGRHSFPSVHTATACNISGKLNSTDFDANPDPSIVPCVLDKLLWMPPTPHGCNNASHGNT